MGAGGMGAGSGTGAGGGGGGGGGMQPDNSNAQMVPTAVSFIADNNALSIESSFDSIGKLRLEIFPRVTRWESRALFAL